MAAGATMGFATILVPGGNDTLLLSALQSLELHGAVAYLAMLSVQISLSLAAKRRKDRQLRHHKPLERIERRAARLSSSRYLLSAAAG